MNKLQVFIQEKPCGFLTSAQMPELIALDRLFPVLVRCGNGRFTCAAQDVAHFMRCVESGGDYVRDVSFPVGSFERAASWQPECPVTPVAMLPASFTAPRNTFPSWHLNRRNGGAFDEEWRGDADPGL